MIIPYPTYSLEPAECAYHGVLKSIVVNGSTNGPSFITLVPNGIRIATNDPDDADEYVISLIIEPNGPTQIPEEIVDYTVIVSACKLDTVSVDELVQDFTYYLDSGPSEPKGGNFIYNLMCGIECTFTQDYSGTYDSSIYTFDEETCIVTVDTSDSSLHNTSMTLQLTGKAPASSDSFTQVFEVTFIDDCQNVGLSEPEFAQ